MNSSFIVWNISPDSKVNNKTDLICNSIRQHIYRLVWWCWYSGRRNPHCNLCTDSAVKKSSFWWQQLCAVRKSPCTTVRGAVIKDGDELTANVADAGRWRCRGRSCARAAGGGRRTSWTSHQIQYRSSKTNWNDNLKFARFVAQTFLIFHKHLVF